jgi:hypothetical protein
VPAPSAQWRFLRGQTFENSIGELELAGRSARVTLRRSPHQDENVEQLVVLHHTDLAVATESEIGKPGSREEKLHDARA